MEIVEACKTIFWICVAICSIVIASMFLVSFVRTNKQTKEQDDFQKKLTDSILNILNSSSEESEKKEKK